MSKENKLDQENVSKEKSNTELAKEKQSLNLEPVYPEGVKKPKMTMR
ncbi:MAG: hypothetical protein FWE14_03980 [Lachnospiraceae bacterium]|nr:hypothetical protein [Lachnospiraceae bacterium]